MMALIEDDILTKKNEQAWNSIFLDLISLNGVSQFPLSVHLCKSVLNNLVGMVSINIMAKILMLTELVIIMLIYHENISVLRFIWLISDVSINWIILIWV